MAQLLRMLHRTAVTVRRLGCAVLRHNALAIDLCFGGLLFLVQLHFPLAAEPDFLDHSWMLAYGEFFKADAQAGVDYVFNFGPLGCFYGVAYDPPLFWHFYAWAVGQSLCLTILIVLLGRKLCSLDLRIPFYIICVVYVAPRNEALLPLGIFAAVFFLGVGRPGIAVLVLASLFLAVVSLVKFTFAAQAFAGIFLVCVCRILEVRRPDALLPFVLYTVWLLLLWLALGQSPANLFVYAETSLELSRGYSAGMRLVRANPTFFVSCLLLGGNIGLWVCLGLKRPYLTRSIVLAAFAILSLFMKWKHGVVRDDLHLLDFYGFAIAMPFVRGAASPTTSNRTAYRLAVATLTLLAITGIAGAFRSATFPRQFANHDLRQQLRDNLRSLLNPDGLRADLEKHRVSAAEQWLLPQVKALVGDETVDVFSAHQGVVFVNGLHWTPRPIFQGYQAYTRRLEQINARFYQGRQAPRFVLIRFEWNDNHLPAHDDGAALLELLRRYRPVLEEKGFLLLERQVERRDADYREPSWAEQRTIRWGEQVHVPERNGAYVTLALELQLTTAGQLLQAAYRPPLVLIHLVMANGEEKTWRLIPEMAREPFLLAPLVQDNKEILQFYAGASGKRLASFSLTVAGSQDTRAYAPNFEMKLAAYDFP